MVLFIPAVEACTELARANISGWTRSSTRGGERGRISPQLVALRPIRPAVSTQLLFGEAKWLLGAVCSEPGTRSVAGVARWRTTSACGL